jgi:uncharacterized protein
MRVLFALNHPAHYYLFKYIEKSLRDKGYETKIVIRDKDILERLLISEGAKYTIINRKRNRKKNAFSVISKGMLELVQQDINMFKVVRKFKPAFLLGTDIAITHIGKLQGIPSFVFNEDDYEINQIFCKASYPFATYIVAPNYTSVGKHINKKISYNGIQKMAYLNKKYFIPNNEVLNDLGLDEKDSFVIIRLVSLTAGHDIEGKHNGISIETLEKIINILKDKYKIFITSEEKLPDDYMKYQVKIKLNRMHDLMYYSNLFIGDSQTMCAEAGILGTPFIRYNDFVGKIEVLNDLENNYKLGWGIKTSQTDKLYKLLQDFIQSDNVKEEWQKKKEKLFNEKDDLTEMIVNLIQTYPESVEQV